jgi:hypothetical protein
VLGDKHRRGLVIIKLHKGNLASATVDSPPGHRKTQGQDHVPAGWKGEESLKESLKFIAEGYWTLCRSAAVLGDKASKSAW